MAASKLQWIQVCSRLVEPVGVIGSQGGTRVDGRDKRACQEGGVYDVYDNQSMMVISSASQVHMFGCSING